MNKKNRVLVLGSGFAGQGHAEAFRRAGAEVVGMVSRTEKVVREVAGRMNIPYAGSDWEKALEECRPDIVSIATPGGAHFEPVCRALEAGCHVYSDKPLAETAEKAEKMYRLAVEKGVKTAYAASYRYMPAVIYAKRLIAEGAIGTPLEAESNSHFHLDPLIPLGWSHRIDQGGGRLNNNFTHLLSIMNYVLGDRVTAVKGEVRSDMSRAPVVKGVHNFTERRNFIPDNPDDPDLEWGEADAEWSYTVLAHIESALETEQPVSVVFRHSGLQPRFHDDHLIFYGSGGALYIQGHYGGGRIHILKGRGEWEELDIPSDIAAAQPDIEDDTLRNWSILADLFVKDINGMDVEPYQTFYDGWRYQKIIELVRRNGDWTDLSRIFAS